MRALAADHDRTGTAVRRRPELSRRIRRHAHVNSSHWTVRDSRADVVAPSTPDRGDYLIKPFDLEELRERLESYVTEATVMVA